MLSFILLIFKIIGIILLALLGLLITLILTILLVPIRYRIAVEHGEELFRIQGRVHWLLHILHGKITHLDGKLHIIVRLFGFVLYDNQKPRTGKKKTKLKKTARTKPVRNKKTGEAEERVETEKAVEAREVVDIMDDRSNTEISNVSDGKADEHKGLKAIAEENDTAKIMGEAGAAKTEAVKTEADVIEAKVTGEEKEPGSDDLSLFKKLRYRLRLVIEKIKNAKNKTIAFLKGLKAKLISIADSISNLKHKIGLISDFIKDEVNREGFQFTYASIKQLMKHILPKKLESRVVFGTGDPCTTGQILAVLGVFYGFYGDKVQIIPDFEHAGVEGKHYARGRIRLGTLLMITIKLLVDKRFKQLKGNFQILKEAL